MKSSELRLLFKSPGPAVLPVIHAVDTAQVISNVEVVLCEGAPGVFLINHDFDYPALLPMVEAVRARFPDLWMGLNFLAVTGANAFPVLGQLQNEGIRVDAYWGDDARIDEASEQQLEAQAISEARAKSSWSGLYFGGTAFKKQREVAPSDFCKAASIARDHMDVVTTSGVATGHAAELAKIERFREGVAEHALAVASGVTPDNVDRYAPLVDAILVATGINRAGDFYHLDSMKLRRLLAKTRAFAAQKTSCERSSEHFLKLMAPNVKGEKFAWIDPSTMYINARSFHALLDDLVAPFDAGSIDVVAGFDAAGFVLGAAIATRLGKGFLTIRKSGKLPVETDSVSFVNYSGREQRLEMRKPAFAPGTRVLLVDQWIETGGTMRAGIELVEAQGGSVAGIAAICIEESASTGTLKQQYQCVSAVRSGSDFQTQCNGQHVEHAEDYDPNCYFPDTPGACK